MVQPMVGNTIPWTVFLEHMIQPVKHEPMREPSSTVPPWILPSLSSWVLELPSPQWWAMTWMRKPNNSFPPVRCPWLVIYHSNREETRTPTDGDAVKKQRISLLHAPLYWEFCKCEDLEPPVCPCCPHSSAFILVEERFSIPVTTPLGWNNTFTRITYKIACISDISMMIHTSSKISVMN